MLEVGDWERRNRLKVYEGLFCITVREFGKAAQLFLDSISTFSAYELLPYSAFIRYTVLTAVVTLDRVSLKKKVIDAPEVLSVIREVPHASEYLNSLYDCEYAEFFRRLAEVSDSAKLDFYLAPHAAFYTKEARVVAYTQFLLSYKSVTLDSMAERLGVTPAFVDTDLSRFIAAGRIHAKIDAYNRVIETTRPETKNAQYADLIKQGDALLNRIQKLSRVISL